MAEKLKSILKQTNWSLVLKALVFAVAWWALPFWLFLIIALYLYFFPITGTGKVSVPFFVLLLISLLQSQSIIAAILFAAIFYFILLIKDLLIIDRRSAYEVLLLVLSYLLVRSFFLNTGDSLGLRAILYSVVGAWAVSGMVISFVKNFSAAGAATKEEPEPHEARLFHRMLGWLIFLIVWQLLLVGLFLPLDFLYQSAIIFLVAGILITLVPQYAFGELSRTKALATGTLVFALLVVIAASARWIL